MIKSIECHKVAPLEIRAHGREIHLLPKKRTDEKRHLRGKWIIFDSVL
jgi:hypothetical protein